MPRGIKRGEERRTPEELRKSKNKWARANYKEWTEKQKESRRIYARKWKDANRDSVAEFGRNWRKKRRKEREEHLNNYKLNVGCEMCGYDKHSVALDFHHRDPKTKEFDISHGFNLRWDRVVREIDKCDVICANCHRVLHSSGSVEA